MATPIEQYKQIAQEAKAYHGKITDILKMNKNVADLYKGSQILFSPFMEYPDILLIGIRELERNILSFFILNEQITISLFIGAMLVVSGVYFTNASKMLKKYRLNAKIISS